MSNKEISTEVEEIQEAPPVATIWPTTVSFTEDEKSAAELSVKYGHLRQLDIDDKPAYKELVAAIADARNKRLDISKQEDVIKDPINKYRTLLINTSKKIQGLFGDVESDLKKEKKRIDDIREERKLAMERLWQENLNSVRSMTEGLPSMGIISLNMLLDDLNNFDFESLDFGDYIEQAKATVDNQINSVAERIEILKEKERLKEERFHRENVNNVHNFAVQLDLKTDEQLQEIHDKLNNFDLSSMDFGGFLEEARESLELSLNRCRAEYKRRSEAKAERHRLKLEAETRDEEKAEADRKQAETDAENQRLREQLAAMEKKNEPESEPEITIVSQGEVTMIEDSLVDIEPPVAGRAAAIEQEPESTVVREDPKQVEDEEEGNIDPICLAVWAKEISKVKNISPIVLTPKGKKAVEAVLGQIDEITGYLIKTAESLR